MAPIARWPKSNRCSAYAYQDGEWRPTVVRTEATTGRGLDDLVDHITRFRAQSPSLESRRRTRVHTQLRAILAARLLQQVESGVSELEMGSLVDRIMARTIDPCSAADEVLGGGARAPATRHESVSGSCRHRGCRPRGVVVLLPRCARAARRSSRRRRVATRPGAVYFDRAVISRAPPGDGARFAHREVSREARSRFASHHAEGRRYPGRAD